MTAIARIERALDRIDAKVALAEAKLAEGGGESNGKFIDRCVASAADMALLFVGASHEQMLAHLVTVRERMKVRLEGSLGTEVATSIAESFVATVARCKVEIERVTVGNSEAIQ